MKCRCCNCGNGIEFESSYAGETIQCPHCQTPTKLSKKTPALFLVWAILFLTVAISLFVFGILRSTTEKNNGTSTHLQKTLAQWENLGFKTIGASGHYEHLVCSVNKVFGSTILVDILKEETWPEKWTGAEEVINREYVKSIIVLHYPTPKTLVSGQGLTCTCWHTDNYITPDGTSLVAYDCQ